MPLVINNELLMLSVSRFRLNNSGSLKDDDYSLLNRIKCSLNFIKFQFDETSMNFLLRNVIWELELSCEIS